MFKPFQQGLLVKPVGENVPVLELVEVFFSGFGFGKVFAQKADAFAFQNFVEQRPFAAKHQLLLPVSFQEHDLSVDGGLIAAHFAQGICKSLPVGALVLNQSAEHRLSFKLIGGMAQNIRSGIIDKGNFEIFIDLEVNVAVRLAGIALLSVVFLNQFFEGPAGLPDFVAQDENVCRQHQDDCGQ